MGFSRFFKLDLDGPGKGRMTAPALDGGMLRFAAREGICPVPVAWYTSRRNAGDTGLLPITAQRPSVDAATGALSLQLIYFGPIKKRPRNTRLSITCVNSVESLWDRYNLMLISYSRRLVRMIEPRSDHIFYPKLGPPLLMRKVNEHSEDYSIIAPLHSVWVLLPEPEDQGKTFNVMDLANVNLMKLVNSQLPVLGIGGRITDPQLEGHNPRLASLRDSRTALRLRQRVFPGATTVRDILPSLEKLVRIEPEEESTRELHGFLLACWGINSSFRLNRKRFFDPSLEFLELRFREDKFQYLRKWYLDALYTEAEDPHGLLRREEKKLAWGDEPAWEWYHEDRDYWALVANSEVLKAFLGGGLTPWITLRVAIHPIIRHLQRNLWEAKVMRKLTLVHEGIDQSVKDARGLATPTDLLGKDRPDVPDSDDGESDKDGDNDGDSWVDYNDSGAESSHARIVDISPPMPSYPTGWPTDLVRDHHISGKHMSVRIL